MIYLFICSSFQEIQATLAFSVLVAVKVWFLWGKQGLYLHPLIEKKCTFLVVSFVMLAKIVIPNFDLKE